MASTAVSVSHPFIGSCILYEETEQVQPLPPPKVAQQDHRPLTPHGSSDTAWSQASLARALTAGTFLETDPARNLVGLTSLRNFGVYTKCNIRAILFG